MADDSIASPTTPDKATTFLEKLVDLRILVLWLCLFFYLDIWLIRLGYETESLTISNIAELSKAISVTSILFFLASFSLLMAGFFPALRLLTIAVLAHIKPSKYSGSSNPEHVRLSTWCFALVLLSGYDAARGWFSNSYHGLAIHLIDIVQADGFESSIFRLSACLFWLFCLAAALQDV